MTSWIGAGSILRSEKRSVTLSPLPTICSHWYLDIVPGQGENKALDEFKRRFPLTGGRGSDTPIAPKPDWQYNRVVGKPFLHCVGQQQKPSWRTDSNEQSSESDRFVDRSCKNISAPYCKKISIPEKFLIPFNEKVSASQSNSVSTSHKRKSQLLTARETRLFSTTKHQLLLFSGDYTTKSDEGTEGPLTYPRDIPHSIYVRRRKIRYNFNLIISKKYDCKTHERRSSETYHANIF